MPPRSADSLRAARPLVVALFAAVSLALLVCAGVAAQLLTLGSSDGGWTYNYVRPFTWWPLVPSIVSTAGIAAVVAVARRYGAHPLLLTTILVVFSTLVHCWMRTLAPEDVETIFLSPGANSYYTLSLERTPRELLGSFQQVRRHAPLHARGNMPGKTILLHALEVITPRTTVLPWLVIGFSNLGALLMYAFVRELLTDETSGVYAAVLYLFTPARVLFLPLMNSVTPVFVLAFSWLLIRALRRAGAASAMSAGVALYLVLFFEPLPLVMGLLFAALTAALIITGVSPLNDVLVQVGLVLGMFVLMGIAVYVVTGFDAMSAFRQISRQAVEFNRSEGRSYGLWIWANLPEFGFGAGPAQVVLLVTTAVIGWKGDARAWWTSVTAVGLLAVLLTTDIIGINRGEVIRLWTFLACFFQVPAAAVCARLVNPLAFFSVLGVTLLQICLAAATVAFIIP